MDIITSIGIIAGMLTTLSFLPQVIKTWRERSAKDLSLSMFLAFCAGVFLWIIYGVCLKSPPIIIANSLTFLLAATILHFKLKYG
jgi:MtN3 and saliva related transmembrane protein